MPALSPGSVLHLIKTFTIKDIGTTVSYKLHRNAVVRVLVLGAKDCQTEAEQIAMIDAAAATAKENIRLAYAARNAT